MHQTHVPIGFHQAFHRQHRALVGFGHGTGRAVPYWLEEIVWKKEKKKQEEEEKKCAGKKK
jgi:hypothetical protein